MQSTNFQPSGSQTQNEQGDFATTFKAKIEYVRDQAQNSSGLCYELYEARFQDAASGLLLTVAPENADVALAIAIEAGYQTDFQPEEFEPGTCGLTGIDTHCCPCGQHP